jgi:Na+ dependent nucleoside transporter N-terminus
MIRHVELASQAHYMYGESIPALLPDQLFPTMASQQEQPIVYDDRQIWVSSVEVPQVATNDLSPKARTVSSASISGKDEKLTFEKSRQAETDRDEGEMGIEKKSQRRARPFVLTALALTILAWWISATVLKATRHRWIPQTVWSWFFILVIAFRFIPNSIVTRPVQAVWQPIVSRPFMRLPYYVRLSLGWLCLLGIVFGSAFGFPTQPGTNRGDRAISVLGLFIFQCGFFLSSRHKNSIQWRTIIVGLFIQQAIAMFVLKSGAGFHIFNWLGIVQSMTTWIQSNYFKLSLLLTSWSNLPQQPSSSLMLKRFKSIGK